MTRCLRPEASFGALELDVAERFGSLRRL